MPEPVASQSKKMSLSVQNLPLKVMLSYQELNKNTAQEQDYQYEHLKKRQGKQSHYLLPWLSTTLRGIP